MKTKLMKCAPSWIKYIYEFVLNKSANSQKVLSNGELVIFRAEAFHQLLVGDQLTAARHGNDAARCDHDTRISHLYGIVPLSEDWHAKYHLCRI